MNTSIHRSVLYHEVVAGLSGLKPGSWYLDGTLGGAGHATLLLDAYKGQLKVIGLDRDPRAIERAQAKLEGKTQHLILEREDYRNLDTVLDRHSIPAVDLILLDLGLSSDELENSGKGFSFQKDEPLLMTFGDPATYTFTAKTIVNSWEENSIADIIYAYGEERFSRRIARAIIDYRQKKQIETSVELAEIVKNSLPLFYRKRKIHPATTTFQALRIAVNDELGALHDGLKKGFARLNSGGRLAVISFHSLEDRIVKRFYTELIAQGAIRVTKKPIRAESEEIKDNPRSRSAKLRIIEKQ